MELRKIFDSVIPNMHNSPCKIAVFTDGKRCKVFQRDFGGWNRNFALEAYGTPQRIEQIIDNINTIAKEREEMVRRNRL